MKSVAPGRVIYRNAHIVDPASGFDGPGELFTIGEDIADVGKKLFDSVPADIEVVDCDGQVLAPGLVDMRVQLREPGEEHKESLKSGGEAAVAGGVTTMVCLPNTDPVMDDEPTLEFVARRARQLALTKVYCYGALTKGLQGKELAEMGLLAKAGALAFTDATKAVADAQVMRRALQYAATFNLLIVQHPEEPTLATGVMNAGEIATRMGLSGIPREAEIIMLERDVRLAAMTGGRYHAAHISTSESVEIIRRAKDAGVQVTCDTAPFYFALNELSVGDYRTFAKLSPPLRSDEDRQAIVAGLKSGVIDAIASDHAPQDQDSKRLPFPQAAFGGSGLETLLAVSLDLFHNGEMSLLEVVRRLTLAPASLLGLRAGRLAKGAKADLVLFDPQAGWKVIADGFRSKSKNSPFDGRPVQGRVLRTVVDGRTVFDAVGAEPARPNENALRTGEPMSVSVILAALFGYFLGSVPFGLLLTRAAGVGDIRKVGSGNIGATNVLRTGHKGLALATLLLDGGKGAVAVLIARSVDGSDDWLPLVAGIAAVVGHNFPVWLKFKGGKGVATTLGTMLAAAPVIGLMTCVTWAAVAAASRISSLAALVSLALAPLYAMMMGDRDAALAFLILAVLGWIRHRANLQRLAKGEEPRIGTRAKPVEGK